MQLAHIMLALGGDRDNTVSKRSVTPSEIAVLQLIHGNEAVFDIGPAGEVKRSHRDERARLIALYGQRDAKGDGMVSPAVNELFPGAAARLFETLDELELTPDMFLATARASVAAPTPAGTAEEPAAGVFDDTEDDSGIGEMPSGDLMA